nr:hypothetical protein [Tanacetum cinerariifolium]
MDNKKHIVNLESFREMLHICPRLPGQSFFEPPFEEEILSFLHFLGHNEAIRRLTDININKLHQPWRSFAAIINKCLTRKSSGYDSLRLSQAQILWGLYQKRNVDFAYLMWEDFVYQVEHKDTKMSNEMYYPRFTKFGAMLPIELTNADIENSDTYKEYYAVATGATQSKPKASEEISWNSTNEEGDDNDDDEGDDGDDVEEGNDDDDDDQEDERNDEDDQEEEIRDEESFDPIPKTPENTDDEGNGEENLGTNVGREEGHDEEDEEDELYRDSSSVSSQFVTSMLNPTHDAGMETIFEMTSQMDVQSPTSVAPLPMSALTLTHSTIATITTTQQEPTPSKTAPSTLLQDLPNFGSLFGFDHQLKTLEANFSEFTQTNQFVGAVSSIPGIYNFSVRDDDANKDEEPSAGSDRGSKRRREGKEPESVSAPREKATRSAGKSTQGASSRKYRTSVTKIKAVDYGHIKWIEDLVPRTMWIQEPVGYDKHALCGISHWGRKRQQFYGFAINRESARDVYSKRRIIAVTELRIVERAKDLQLVVESYQKKLNLTRPDTYRSVLKHKEAYIAYSNPRGFIYQNKDKQNRLMRIDKLHKFYNGTLIDVLTTLDDHLKSADDQPNVEPSQHPEWFSQQKKPPTPDLDTLTPKLLANPTYELMKGSCKSLVELKFFLEEVYKATTDQLDWVNPEGQQYPHNLLKPLSLIPNNRGRHVIPFDHFINNDLEYLREGASSRKYRTSVTKIKAVDYGHIKWIEDLVPRTMWIQEPVGYNKHALCGIPLGARVKDLQLVVESYQKKLNLTRPDTYRSVLKYKEAYTAYSNPRGFIYQNKDKQNRLMMIDKLHKFYNGTLIDVLTTLDDHLKSIQMKYLTQTIWRKSDKDKEAALIQAIDKILKTRRIMRSFKRFAGGRLYEGDFRMLQRTI